MKEWMSRLAAQQRDMRRRYPDGRLIVVFDIDDTILDLRHMILHVLQSYDRRHDTRYFAGLGFGDIGVNETHVREVMEELRLPVHDGQQVQEWFRRHSWSSPVVRHAHRPFPGVMGVIRWLQNQPGTFVGLNTGRPEGFREDTLDCLNGIGREHGVTFADDLLYEPI
jgi:phosphoglycolate phosphatase-like HAD superfamily hydrolase